MLKRGKPNTKLRRFVAHHFLISIKSIVHFFFICTLKKKSPNYTFLILYFIVRSSWKLVCLTFSDSGEEKDRNSSSTRYLQTAQSHDHQNNRKWEDTTVFQWGKDAVKHSRATLPCAKLQEHQVTRANPYVGFYTWLCASHSLWRHGVSWVRRAPLLRTIGHHFRWHLWVLTKNMEEYNNIMHLVIYIARIKLFKPSKEN